MSLKTSISNVYRCLYTLAKNVCLSIHLSHTTHYICACLYTLHPVHMSISNVYRCLYTLAGMSFRTRLQSLEMSKEYGELRWLKNMYSQGAHVRKKTVRLRKTQKRMFFKLCISDVYRCACLYTLQKECVLRHLMFFQHVWTFRKVYVMYADKHFSNV